MFMQFDAEGNLSYAVTDDGIDVIGDDYGGGPAIVSTDGMLFVYADYSKSPSPHYTDAVSVRRTTDSSVVGKWTVDQIVGDIQSDEGWLVITELGDGVATGGSSKIIGTAAINLETGTINRVESSLEVLLPR